MNQGYSVYTEYFFHPQESDEYKDNSRKLQDVKHRQVTTKPDVSSAYSREDCPNGDQDIANYPVKKNPFTPEYPGTV